jgi:dihydroneopterin aldolase / 2-amino-4-hydroxy-6-hydroxymethyldihydropteridine diphosphokinase
VDRIEITAWRALTVIGALDFEQLAAQPIEVDAILHVDLEEAGETDDLSATVHYGLVVDGFAKVASDPHVLLERLAHRFCEVALSFPLVQEVELVVRKLRPPVPHDVAHTAVRLHRRRMVSHAAGTHEAILALGSNLGDRESFLRLAVAELAPVRQSQVWETDPVGGPERQGPYLNMVVAVRTDLDPFALLRRCQRIERLAGRVRDVRWGPRTLDIDILFYDDMTLTSDALELPHPRLADRRFVLAPLAEVAPERCPAGWDESLPAGGAWAVGPLT